MTRAVPGTVLAVDVGGTTVKSGRWTGIGSLLDPAATPTPGDRDPDGRAVLDLVARLVAESHAVHALDAVGLVVPGLVDEQRGVARWSENLGWRDAAFRDQVSERTGLPVAFGHDVRAGGLAESQVGAGAGHRSLVFLPIGTGIAAAVVVDGVTLSSDGFAGEIGHVDVGHSERCRCGLSGCLEALSSASAIARRYGDRAGHRVEGAAEVAARAREGDQVAREVWSEALDGIALALAWTASVLAPEVVVVGGGLARAGQEQLFEPLQFRLAERLSFQRVPEVVPAELGDQAGCYGAALLAWRELTGEGR